MTVTPLSYADILNLTTAIEFEAGLRLARPTNPEAQTQYSAARSQAGYYRPSYSFISSRSGRVTIEAPRTRAAVEEDRQKREESKANFSLILGIFTLLGGIFALGFTLRAQKAQGAALNKMRLANRQLFGTSKGLLDQRVFDAFSNLLAAQLSIDKERMNTISNYNYSVLGAVVAGSTLVAGGLLAAPILMIAGKVVLIASAALALYNLSSHWDDEANFRNTYSLMLDNNSGLVAKVKEAIHQVQTTPTAPPLYNWS